MHFAPIILRQPTRGGKNNNKTEIRNTMQWSRSLGKKGQGGMANRTKSKRIHGVIQDKGGVQTN